MADRKAETPRSLGTIWLKSHRSWVTCHILVHAYSALSGQGQLAVGRKDDHWLGGSTRKKIDLDGSARDRANPNSGMPYGCKRKLDLFVDLPAKPTLAYSALDRVFMGSEMVLYYDPLPSRA